MPYDFELSDDEKRELLRIARAGLREFFRSGRLPPGKPHRDSLVALAGVFVSLYTDEELRGCVGSFDEVEPVFKAVQNMAVGAATRDPRFEPVTRDELPGVVFEISVLGAHRTIAGPDEIQAGVHGVAITCGPRRGLLLPQVATDRGWDGATLLANACDKAGLPEDAWQRDDVTVEVFTAQVFDDNTHPSR